MSMGFVRVTQDAMVYRSVQRLSQRLSQFDRASQSLASGKHLLKPSDDPAGMNRVFGLRAQLRAREQEARTAEDTRNLLHVTDSAIQTMTDTLRRINDLAIRAGGQTDSGSRNAIKTEMAALQEELVTVANSQVDGRPLFAGLSGESPVVRDAGAPNGWRFDGDPNGVIMRRVSESDLVPASVNALDLFGDFATDPNNLLTTVDRIMTALDSGNIDGIRGELSTLDGARRRIADQHVKIGTATNRIENAMRRNEDDRLAIRGELAQLEDVDLAAAVMELQTQEVAYQATLGALSRVLQPSLVNFLR